MGSISSSVGPVESPILAPIALPLNSNLQSSRAKAIWVILGSRKKSTHLKLPVSFHWGHVESVQKGLDTKT